MGTKIALYYNPATADTFEEPTDSPSLQKVISQKATQKSKNIAFF